eukprot:NODE_53_length_26956_cov_0.387348.p11 type:complete len:261 gc:universal NODE_53_length_26956_cov_0.387348:9880-9098(-)
MLRPLFVLLNPNKRHTFSCRIMIKQNRAYDNKSYCYTSDIEDGFYTVRDFELKIINEEPRLFIYKCELIQKQTIDLHCKLYDYKNGVRDFFELNLPFANSFKGANRELDAIYDEKFTKILSALEPQESQNKLDYLMVEMSPSFDTGYIPTSQEEYLVNIDTVSVSGLELQHGKTSDKSATTKIFGEVSKQTEFSFSSFGGISPQDPVYSQDTDLNASFIPSLTNLTRVTSVVTRPKVNCFDKIESLERAVSSSRKRLKIE